MMRGSDWFMIAVIFLNSVLCVFFFLQGETATSVGWLGAVVWSMRSHGLEFRLRRYEDGQNGGKNGENDDFTRFLE